MSNVMRYRDVETSRGEKFDSIADDIRAADTNS